MSDYEENGVAGDGFHSEDGGGRGGEIDEHRDSESKVCAPLAYCTIRLSVSGAITVFLCVIGFGSEICVRFRLVLKLNM